MALIDDPRAWILRLFEMEEREGRGASCVRFPDGIRPDNLPLKGDERVFGIFKGKYHFTAESLIIGDDNEAERIPWAEIRSCSSQHGEGKTTSELTLVNGRKVRVKIGDMATGWSGRISQLYHQMIERHGHRASLGRPLMPLHEFFAMVTDDFSIAPSSSSAAFGLPYCVVRA